MDDAPVDFDDYNVPTTVVHFKMGGRHAIFGFFRHLRKPIKQGKNKLGIFCSLCVQALEGTGYVQ
jgi:hypothetical protein